MMRVLSHRMNRAGNRCLECKRYIAEIRLGALCKPMGIQLETLPPPRYATYPTAIPLKALPPQQDATHSVYAR